jgi:hypothetical protein
MRAGVPAVVEERAADHLFEERLVGPLGEESELVPGRRAQENASMRSDGTQASVVEYRLGNLRQLGATPLTPERQLVEQLGAQERAKNDGARQNRAVDAALARPSRCLQERGEPDCVGVLDLLEVDQEALRLVAKRRVDGTAESRHGGAREHPRVLEASTPQVSRHDPTTWMCKPETRNDDR